MSICGIEIKAKEAILALVDDVSGRPVFKESEVKKIPIGDFSKQQVLRSFLASINSVFRSEAVEYAFIIQRNEKGKFAASGPTFKAEAIIQLNEVADCEIIHGKTIEAILKKKKKPAKPKTKYQEAAFEAACAGFFRVSDA